jgi:hypothetical protein
MSSITRRQFLRGSAVAAGAALLTACQPQAQPSTGNTGNQAAEQPKAADPTAVVAVARDKKWPLGDVPRNRTLVYYNGAMTPGLCSPLVTGYNHQNGHAILWEPAAYYGAHADKTYMWLAESFQYNDNATQSHGQVPQGHQVERRHAFHGQRRCDFIMERLKRVDGLNRSATYKAELENAEVVDDQTLKHQPEPDRLAVLLQEPDLPLRPGR